MAKRRGKNEEKLNYNAEIRRLKDFGPQRLYVLYGPEDYLRELYLEQLKKICLPEGEDSFSYKRMNGPELDAHALREAVDAMPFLTERSMVELRDVDFNRLKDADSILSVLKDIPEYCTVVVVQNAQYEFDKRIRINKSLFERSQSLYFNQQSQSDLINWVIRRFSAAGKQIELEAAQRLIFVSGDLMNKLIPEIEKIAAYTRGEKVTAADVDAVASHLPEAVIFEMTDYISQKKYNAAVSVLAELLSDKSDKNNDPTMMLSVLGKQMRQLYAARLALESGQGPRYLMDHYDVKHEFVANALIRSARGFTLEQLIRAVELCTETDHLLKSSPRDNEELLQEVVLRIAAGESRA